VLQKGPEYPSAVLLYRIACGLDWIQPLLEYPRLDVASTEAYGLADPDVRYRLGGGVLDPRL